MAKEPVPFKTLARVVLIVTGPCLLLLAGLVFFKELELAHFLMGYGFVLLATAFLVHPILSNLQTLTRYVLDIAEDKKPPTPNLGLLNISSNLSSALVQLYRNWREKKHQMESIITEREILVDTLPDILIMTNDDKVIVRTNRAARHVFGQNMAGKALKKVIDSDVLLNAVTAVIDDLKGRETDFHLSEPEPKDMRAVIEHFPIASKGGISVIITLNDVTQLKQIQKMRADFVSNASHEIRTPLTSIAGLIETIQGPARDDPEAQKQFLAMMGEQAERMKNLISDLLSLSKIEMNAHRVPTEAVEMPPMIEKEAAQFAWAVKNKNMKVVIDCSEDLPPVRGEENELKQVIHNLLGNAIKYGFSDSEVSVTARVTSDLPRDTNFIQLNRAMVITVRDQGEGIPREHLPRLTERFYRVDSARTRKVGGTGLGLAIVKHILQRHRGALLIDSVVGEGSSFHVYLPLKEDT
jgi:two-component system phosphate regulon sensor histidine kinase PhoR